MKPVQLSLFLEQSKPLRAPQRHKGKSKGHRNPNNTIPIEDKHKWKRGTIGKDGRIFWQWAKHRNGDLRPKWCDALWYENYQLELQTKQ